MDGDKRGRGERGWGAYLGRRSKELPNIYIYRKREKVMVVAVVMTIMMRRRSKRGTWWGWKNLAKGGKEARERGNLGGLRGGGEGAERWLQYQYHTATLRKAADPERAWRARARAKGGETRARGWRRRAAVYPRAGLVAGEEEERAGIRASEQTDSRQAVAIVGTRSFPYWFQEPGRAEPQEEKRDELAMARAAGARAPQSKKCPEAPPCFAGS